jgi:hypothetical protein
MRGHLPPLHIAMWCSELTPVRPPDVFYKGTLGPFAGCELTSHCITQALAPPPPPPPPTSSARAHAQFFPFPLLAGLGPGGKPNALYGGPGKATFPEPRETPLLSDCAAGCGVSLWVAPHQAVGSAAAHAVTRPSSAPIWTNTGLVAEAVTLRQPAACDAAISGR